MAGLLSEGPKAAIYPTIPPKVGRQQVYSAAFFVLMAEFGSRLLVKIRSYAAWGAAEFSRKSTFSFYVSNGDQL